jgi:hypothetical protein
MELEAQLANLSRKLEEQQLANREKEKEISEKERHIRRISGTNPTEEISSDFRGIFVSSNRYKNTRSKSNINIEDLMPSLAQSLAAGELYGLPNKNAEDAKKIVDVASEDEEQVDREENNLLDSILNVGDINITQGVTTTKDSYNMNITPIEMKPKELESIVERKESVVCADKATQASIMVSAQGTQIERYRFEVSQLIQCDIVITKNKSLQTESNSENAEVQTDLIPKPLEEVKSEVGDLERLRQFFNMVIL